jgi:hypothetical protein
MPLGVEFPVEKQLFFLLLSPFLWVDCPHVIGSHRHPSLLINDGGSGLEHGSQDFSPVSPVKEVLVEVPGGGNVVALFSVLALEAEDIAKDNTLKDTRGMGRLRWDEEKQFQGLMYVFVLMVPSG